ncbi:MAG: glycosyltransferase [Planctomycetota bacterium]|nr:glycosyltransferase [Planctomycetota bacterium]
MRILHYMQAIDFRHGGPPRAVVDQVATMHDRGHEAGLLTTIVEDVPPTWVDGSTAESTPEVVQLPAVAGPLNRLSSDGCRLAKEVVGRYDIVHLHGVWETSNLQIAAACRAAGTPYVVSLRGMLDDWAMRQKPWKKQLYLLLGGRAFLQGAAAVHCTAEYERQQSRRRFGRARAEVIPNLVDLRPYADRPDPVPARNTWPEIDREEQTTVLFLSRLHPGKGVDMLIDAVATLRARGEDLHLVIAGNGTEEYERFLRRRADDAGLTDHITWTGFISGDVKLSLFAAADVFALPTMQENFGFVMFEALAAGTPVVSSNLVDTRDEIAASGGGVVVERTVGDFAEAISSFVTGRRDARTMGDAGRVWTLEHLSADRVAGAFESLYASCVGRD